MPTEGGTLKEVIVGQPQSLNPLFSTLNEADRDVSELIFAGLLKYNSNGKIVKDLAKDYTRSKNGLSYEFVLKDNIFWSDGHEITTQDVLFTIQSIQDPEVQSPLRIIWQDIKVEQKDNKTIKFTLPNAYPTFFENFTVKIIPYHVFQEVFPQDFILHPPENLTGSGQFEVKVIEEDEEKNIKKIILRRNPNFHGKKTFLEEVEISFVTKVEDFDDFKNQANSFSGLSPEQTSDFQKRFHIYQLAVPRYFALFLRQNNDILSSQRVRKALAFATPKDNIIDKVLNSNGRIVNGPFLPEHNIGGNLKKYKFDIKTTERLLDKDGWQDKNKDGIREKILKGNKKATPLKLTLLTAEQEELTRVAEIIKESWIKIGVEIDIKIMDPTKLIQENIKERKYTMLLFGQGLSFIPDPYPFWSSLQKEYPGLNLSLYQNGDVDELLKEARVELDPSKRKSLFRKIQYQITDDVPAVFLYSPYYLYAVDKNIKGPEMNFVIDPSKRFVDIEYWYINEERVAK